MRFDRVLIFALATAPLCGCHLFTRLTPDCHSPQEYQRAAQVPPLKVPSGLDTPNTQGALVIPTVELAPPPPGPHDACLDTPPHYVPAPSGRGSGG
jgi:uncharacterized lipoprotein